MVMEQGDVGLNKTGPVCAILLQLKDANQVSSKNRGLLQLNICLGSKHISFLHSEPDSL
jgi:hypothetical protein